MEVDQERTGRAPELDTDAAEPGGRGRLQILLKKLHRIGIELSRIATTDALCRAAVEIGRERLDIDRLSLWISADDPDVLHGTYGTDENGRPRDEHSSRMAATHGSRQRRFRDRAVEVHQDSPLADEHNAAVGHGWYAAAAVRAGEDVVGILYADNLLRQRPFEEHQAEVLGLYGATIGHMYARLRAEQALRERDEELRLALSASRTGIWTWHVRTGRMEWSETMERLHGIAPGTFGGTFEAVAELMHPGDRVSQADMEGSLWRWCDETFTHEFRTLHPDGATRWLSARGKTICDERGEPLYMRGTTVDITERKRNEERMYWLAYHDALTGLPNRTLFADRLAHALAAAGRRGAMAAVLFLDLNRFKVVNDTLGHGVGDALLRAVGERLRTCLRAEDTLARMGGDEFTLLLTDVRTPDDAARVAERVLETLAAPFTTSPDGAGATELFASAGIGISLFPHDGRDASTLLRHADVAMYRAKEMRQGGYRFYAEAMNAAALEHLVLENQLRRALEKRELVLFYQPQVDLRSGRITAVEALVRWRHPEKGLVPPATFIPLAEETGLILPLGQWVLEEACRQAAAWRRAGHTVRVAVNLSARQFSRPDLPQAVQSALDQAGLPADLLELELTETALMQDTSEAAATLQALKDRGVQLSLDDFGTGYSSLAYLRDFPLDVLKVDRAFVGRLGQDDRDRALVHTLVEMAHALNLRVVAEGVENAGQQEILGTLGCDVVQGYRFSAPLPAAEVEHFFTEQ